MAGHNPANPTTPPSGNLSPSRMRLFKALVVLPLWLLIAAAAPAPIATPAPAASPAPTPPPASPSPSPSPNPTPVNAYLTIDVTTGPANTTIQVSGGSFNPGESMSLYWDTPNRVIGSATADSHGNFSNVKVKPFAGEQPGPHRICASVDPQPCAGFLLQAAPTPTPSPSPSPSESPSPTPSASPSSSPTPIPIPAASRNDLDLILKPPLVFLPAAGLVGLIAALAWWLFSVFPRQQRHLPAASVMHRSTRPTWGPASGGTPDAPAPAPADEPRPAWPAPPPASFWDQRPTQPEDPPETDS